MMKMCYIDEEASFADYRDAMLDLEKSYHSVTFVWWTMPIMTTGMAKRDAYNAAMRSFAAANGKWLFDIADIECHDAAGKKLADSGGYETLCADYTTDGGHLNAVGQARMAKAMWVLLADIAAAK
jgi:lysophospholipase L1-like esterase